MCAANVDVSFTLLNMYDVNTTRCFSSLHHLYLFYLTFQHDIVNKGPKRTFDASEIFGSSLWPCLSFLVMSFSIKMSDSIVTKIQKIYVTFVQWIHWRLHYNHCSLPVNDGVLIYIIYYLIFQGLDLREVCWVSIELLCFNPKSQGRCLTATSADVKHFCCSKMKTEANLISLYWNA